MNIIEFLDAIGPVARVLLLSGLVLVLVFSANWIAEQMGWEDKGGIDVTGISERIKSQQLELAAITTRPATAGPLARSLARNDSAVQRHQDHFYPPHGRF